MCFQVQKCVVISVIFWRWRQNHPVCALWRSSKGFCVSLSPVTKARSEDYILLNLQLKCVAELLVTLAFLFVLINTCNAGLVTIKADRHN